MPVCPGIKRDGTRCTVVVSGPKEYCYQHDPRYEHRRRLDAAKAGKSKTPRMVRELHALLEDVTRRVIDGELRPYTGMSVSQLVNTRIALLRFEQDLHEQQVLEERLESLEQMTSSASQQQRRPQWGR